MDEGDDGNASIFIPRATLEHTGQYEIVASNCAGTAKCIGFLSIEQRLPTPPPKEKPAPPVFTRLLNDVTVPSGESVTFEVDVTGSPKPSVSHGASLPSLDDFNSSDEDYELKLYEENERLTMAYNKSPRRNFASLSISNITVNEVTDSSNSDVNFDESMLGVDFIVSEDNTNKIENKFKVDFSTTSKVCTMFQDDFQLKSECSNIENFRKTDLSGPSGLHSLEDNSGVPSLLVDDYDNFEIDFYSKSDASSYLKDISVLKPDEYSNLSNIFYNSKYEYNNKFQRDKDQYSVSQQIYGDITLHTSTATSPRIGIIPDRDTIAEGRSANCNGNFLNTGIGDFVEPIKLIDLWDILKKEKGLSKSPNKTQEDESGYASGSCCLSESQKPSASCSETDSLKFSSGTSSSTNSCEILDEEIEDGYSVLVDEETTRKLDIYRDKYLTVGKSLDVNFLRTDLESRPYNSLLYAHAPHSSYDCGERPTSVLSAISEESCLTDSDNDIELVGNDNSDNFKYNTFPLSSSKRLHKNGTLSITSAHDHRLKSLDILQIESPDERKRLRLQKLKYYTNQLLRSSRHHTLRDYQSADSVLHFISKSSNISSRNIKPFLPIKIPMIHLSSFKLDIPFDGRESYSPINNANSPERDNKYLTKLDNSNEHNMSNPPIQASISEGALVFCIKVYESISVKQLTELVHEKLLKILNVSKSTVDQLRVRFIHADAVDCGSSRGNTTEYMRSFKKACFDSARSVVFEACKLATTSESTVWMGEQMPQSSQSILIPAGYWPYCKILTRDAIYI